MSFYFNFYQNASSVTTFVHSYQYFGWWKNFLGCFQFKGHGAIVLTLLHNNNSVFMGLSQGSSDVFDSTDWTKGNDSFWQYKILLEMCLSWLSTWENHSDQGCQPSWLNHCVAEENAFSAIYMKLIIFSLLPLGQGIITFTGELKSASKVKIKSIMTPISQDSDNVRKSAIECIKICKKLQVKWMHFAVCYIFAFKF